MTTTAFKDWLKTTLSGSETYTVGKLDKTKDKTTCVYGGRSPLPNNPPVGGGGKSYTEKVIRVLVRWGTAADVAESRAITVYAALNNVGATVGTSKAWLCPLNAEPVSLGTDEKGVYEYSIDVKIILL